MKRKIVRFGVGVVVAGTLTSVGLITRDAIRPHRSRADEREWPTATVQPDGGTELLSGIPLVLVAPDGRLELREAPGSERVSVTLEPGTRVRLVDRAELDGEPWYLMELVGVEGQGWIRAEALTIQARPTISFENFQFCLGDGAQPGLPCGSLLPLGEETLWLRWSYRGLNDGDVLQRVLLINGERYQSPPIVWNGPSSGEQLVNLMDHRPRQEPGRWVVRFYVNGDLVSEAEVERR